MKWIVRFAGTDLRICKDCIWEIPWFETCERMIWMRCVDETNILVPNCSFLGTGDVMKSHFVPCDHCLWLSGRRKW